MWGALVTRFILLTFTFLGWGFWELSGGKDFTVGEELDVADASAAQAAATEETPVLEMAAVEATRADDAPAAASIGILAEAPAPAAPTPPSEMIAQASLVTSPASETDAGLVVEAAAEPAPEPELPSRGEFAAGPIIIAGPEIIRPAEPEALSEPLTAGASAPALVRILGDNVNVRMGPGTDYSVLTQLLDGTQVDKVDEQNGWVMIEMWDGQTGWVADFLVAGL